MAYNPLQARKVALNNSTNGTPQNTPFNPYSNANMAKQQMVNNMQQSPNPINIFGKGVDLLNAKNYFKGDRFNFVDTSQQGNFNPGDNDLILGGSKVNMSGYQGNNRIWGANREATMKAMENYARTFSDNKKVYGSGVDLDNAKRELGRLGYDFIDTSMSGNFNPGDNDIVVGGASAALSGYNGKNRLWGQDRFGTQKEIENYADEARAKQEAGDEVNQNYNSEKALLEQVLQQKLAMLEQSKKGINQNFNDQVVSQNQNSKRISNKMDDDYIKRGLGRSSIATTGLTEQQYLNDRAVQDINNRRSNSLSDVEMNKVNANNEYLNSLKALDNDKGTKARALERELLDKYYKRRYQERRDNVQDEHWNKDFGFKEGRAKVDDMHWDKDFGFKEGRAKVEDMHWDKDFGFKQERAKVDDTHWDKDFGFKQQAHADSMSLQKQQLAQQAAANAARSSYYSRGGSGGRKSGGGSNDNAREAAAALDITLSEIKNRVPSGKRGTELNILETQAGYLPEPYRSQILGKISNARPFNTGGIGRGARPTWHP